MGLDRPLETERMILREFVEEDAAEYYVLGSDPEVTRFTGDGFSGLEEAREILLAHPIADYAKYGYGRWACVEKSSGGIIGFAGLKYLVDLGEVDIGYRFAVSHWGRGLATEASRAALAYGFDRLGLERIIGLVMPENKASVRVLEKLGLNYVGMTTYMSEQVARYDIDPVRYRQAGGGDRG